MRNFFKRVSILLLPGIFLAIFSIFVQAQNPVSLVLSVKPAKVKPGDNFTAQLSASINGGWHLYSITQGAGGPIPTRITVAEGVFRSAGKVKGPSPKREMDQNFGIMTEYYSGNAVFSVPVSVDTSAQPGAQTLTINVRYQVCNDTTCLPPKTVKVSAQVEIIRAASVDSLSPKPTASISPTPAPTVTDISEDSNKTTDSDRQANENLNTNESTENLTSGTENQPPAVSGQTLTTNNEQRTTNSKDSPDSINSINSIDSQTNLWSFIWLAATLGALSLLTPCVFPMIPITVSYFTNHAGRSRGRAVRLATIYCLGIVATFTILGMLLAIFVGAAGINLFAANPWVNIIIAAVFLFFAFNLFGAYEINVPTSVLTKLDNLTRSREGEGGGIIGALLMGLTFTLTSFTCTSPFVGTILVSAAGGQWQMPLVGMLAFSAVFALPFFVLALVPQYVSNLPRAGGWMNSIKVSMGFLEVAAAMKFISNVDLVWNWGVFTRSFVLSIWIALGVILAIYLLGKFQLFHDTKPERIGAIRLLSAVLSLAISFYLLTGLFGAKLGELESFLPPDLENTASKVFGKTKDEPEWIYNDLEKARAQAKAENKRVFVDFTGYTCTNCRWMEANVFVKREVEAEMSKFVLAKLFTDGEGETYERQQQYQEQTFKTVALPFYAVIEPDGQTVATFPGLTRNVNEFLDFLQKAQKN